MKSLFSSILIPTGEHIPAASADYIVAGLLDAVFILAGMAAVISLIYSGFMFMTANGEPAKISKARQGIIFTIVGLALVIGAFGIVRFIMTSVTGS